MKSIKLILSMAFLATLCFSCEKQEDNEVSVEAVDTDTKEVLFNNNVPTTILKVNGEEVAVGDLGNGEYLYNGDIVVSKTDLSKILSDQEGVKANWANQRRWSNRTIYYQFASSLSSAKRNTVLRAMRHISNRTRIRFVQGRGRGNYVNVFSGNGNFATVGMRGGRQSFSLSRNNLGVAIHELGHTIGLRHEHQRPDRDRHIRINWNAIPSGSRSNFTKTGRNVGSFDWNSIMLYPSKTRNGVSDMVSIRTGRPFNNAIESGRNYLSSGDIACINAYYR
ncbi:MULTISPECIES: M12 family metallopeptidase [Aquimarina]|uniref:M12 family metallopeptidase n=1 Tax=Aquimarina TaxID=290174 RepID=UPI000944425D|nr:MULTISPECIES: M12 family metallopeptidase [Aquimarina]